MPTRRNFIRAFSVPLLAIPAYSAYSKTSFTEDRVLRVALMGLGSYASRVADAMRDCKRARITGLISGTPAKLSSWGEKYEIPESSRYSYEQVDSIAANPEIDAVYVITPNALHYKHVLQIAKAGKHVFVEKPMALNAKQAKEMIQVCKKANVHLLVGYRMHFEAKTLEVVRMRMAGEFGKPLFFQGLSGFKIGNPNQWRLDPVLAGGGSMMDIGIYSVNGSRYMLGEDPIWVTAQETKSNLVLFKKGVDETIQFQMGFPSGAVASCLSTYSMNNLDRFFLNGEKGFAELMPSTGYGPIKGKTQKGELMHPHITHQTVQMDEFAAIVLDGKKPIVPVDGEEGWKDMVIVDAIYKAVKTGTKVQIVYS